MPAPKLSQGVLGMFITSGIFALLQVTALVALSFGGTRDSLEAEAAPLLLIASLVACGLPAVVFLLVGIEWRRREEEG